MSNRAHLTIKYFGTDFDIKELDSVNWTKAVAATGGHYWSGQNAPAGRHFFTRLLWTDTALYVRFEANQTEPLTVNDKPNLTSKTQGLWNHDVCEIFIAPYSDELSSYFEFEIAPTGEWVDLGIVALPNKRETDWNYASGMQSAARVEKGKVVMAIKIPWKAFGHTPKDRDVWHGNLFRCVGAGPTRGYLAWQPTETAQPNFHVPSKFGEFEFTK